MHATYDATVQLMGKRWIEGKKPEGSAYKTATKRGRAGVVVALTVEVPEINLKAVSKSGLVVEIGTADIVDGLGPIVSRTASRTASKVRQAILTKFASSLENIPDVVDDKSPDGVSI